MIKVFLTNIQLDKILWELRNLIQKFKG